jgi:hypothetical protein
MVLISDHQASNRAVAARKMAASIKMCFSSSCGLCILRFCYFRYFRYGNLGCLRFNRLGGIVVTASTSRSSEKDDEQTGAWNAGEREVEPSLLYGQDYICIIGLQTVLLKALHTLESLRAGLYQGA